MNIAALRTEMGLSLEAFAAEVGLQSRGRMSVIERENRCSLAVALKVEALSGGRIDAASLCEEVRAARHGLADAPCQRGQSIIQSEEKSNGVAMVRS